MTEAVSFNTLRKVKIENENVGSILLDITALKADDSNAPIGDLNKIAVEFSIHRNGSSVPKTVFNDYLDNVLSALYGGTTKYGIATTQRGNGFLINIPLGGCLKLKGKDYAIFKIKAETTSFTALSTSKSEIIVETVPTGSTNPFLTFVSSIPFGNGEQSINGKNLGDSIQKIVLCNDFTADYDDSAKAKPTNGVKLSGTDFSKDSSENLLKIENINLLQYNPTTKVKHLVLYSNPRKLLHKAKFSANFDKPVDQDAKIMVVRRMTA